MCVWVYVHTHIHIYRCIDRYIAIDVNVDQLTIDIFPFSVRLRDADRRLGKIFHRSGVARHIYIDR